MPRRADVPQRPETVNNNPAAQKYNNDTFHEPEAVIMTHAKENGDAHSAATSMLDTYEQASTTGKDSGTASDCETDELTDSFDPLGLSDDPKTAARSATTPWLDYYVLNLRAAWMGYNRLTEDMPGDMREPRRAENNAEKTAPTRVNDIEAAAVSKEHEAARHRLTMTPVLGYYVQDLATNESSSEAPDREADNRTGKVEALKPASPWLGYNRLSMKSDEAAPRYVKHLHQAQRWSTPLNSGLELCSPQQVPSWGKNHQHPTTTTAVRSTAPRQHNTSPGDDIIPDNQSVVKATPIKRKGVVKD